MKNNKRLSTKYLKTGGYSIIVSVIAIAIVIFVNLIANSLPLSLTKYDLSNTKLFTLDEQTEELVKRINEDVTIFFIAQPGK